MTTKYVARYEGKIVGKRTTQSRTYTHAVIGKCDIEHERKRAYDYVATKSDKDNYEYYKEIAECEGKFFAPLDQWDIEKDIGGQTQHTFKGYQGEVRVSAHSHTKAQIADAKVQIEGGFDAFVCQLRNNAIENFEKRVKDGGFQMHVLTWCGRPDLAQKEVNKHSKQYWTPLLDVQSVPAEQVK